MCKTTSSEQAPRPISYYTPQLDLPMGPIMTQNGGNNGQLAIDFTDIGATLGGMNTRPLLSSNSNNNSPVSLPSAPEQNNNNTPSTSNNNNNTSTKKTQPTERKVKPACVNCRRSKVKCEGGIPCKRCLRLSMHDSCKRCEPKKRGRKRKSQQAKTPSPTTNNNNIVPALMSVYENNNNRNMVQHQQQQQQQNTQHNSYLQMNNNNGFINNTRPTMNDRPVVEKRRRPAEGTVADVEDAMPTLAEGDAEKFAIERFAALTGQFRTWRDKVACVPPTETLVHSRFAWFCSYLSHVINDYMTAKRDIVDSQKLVSVWLCTNLAEDVNRYVSTTKPELLKFPDLHTDMNHFKLNIQKEAYRMFPTGVVVLPMQPRPFDQSQRAWVSEKLSEILGYSTVQLETIFSNRNLFERLLDHNSFSTYSGAFWDAVEKGSYSFTSHVTFHHRSGTPMKFTCTYQLEYNQGIPMYATCFLQTTEETYSTFGLEARASFSQPQDKYAMLEPCITPNFDYSELHSSQAHTPTSPSSQELTCSPVLTASPVDDVLSTEWRDEKPAYMWNPMETTSSGCSDSIFDVLQSTGPGLGDLSFL